MDMLYRSSIGAVTLAGVLAVATAALAFDDSKYPDFSGQWQRPRGVGIQWDPSRRLGLDQHPPLTAEYQAVWEASMADQAAGGQGNDAPSRCVPYGMPRMMTTVFPMEIVITPNATHVVSDYTMPRRIYTDGREFPNEIEPNFNGYSIGKWIDENGDGRYDVLEVETRGMKGPRSYDASGTTKSRPSITPSPVPGRSPRTLSASAIRSGSRITARKTTATSPSPGRIMC
jgi:hypothetical protein